MDELKDIDTQVTSVVDPEVVDSKDDISTSDKVMAGGLVTLAIVGTVAIGKGIKDKFVPWVKKKFAKKPKEVVASGSSNGGNAGGSDGNEGGKKPEAN